MRFALIWPGVFALSSASLSEVTPTATSSPTAVQIQERAVKPTKSGMIGISPWNVTTPVDVPQRPVITDYVATNGKWKGSKSDEIVQTLTQTQGGKNKTQTVKAPIAIMAAGTAAGAGAAAIAGDGAKVNIMFSPKAQEKFSELFKSLPKGACELVKRDEAPGGIPVDCLRKLAEGIGQNKWWTQNEAEITAMLEAAGNLAQFLGDAAVAIGTDPRARIAALLGFVYYTVGSNPPTLVSADSSDPNPSQNNPSDTNSDHDNGGKGNEGTNDGSATSTDQHKCDPEAPTGDKAPMCNPCGGSEKHSKCTRGKWSGCDCNPHAFGITVQELGGWNIRLPKFRDDQLDVFDNTSLADLWSKAASAKQQGTLLPEQTPKVNCSNHYANATSIEKDLLGALTKSFCKMGKEEAVLGSSHTKLAKNQNSKVAFKMHRSKDCQASCEQGFEHLFNECEGINSHVAQPKGIATVKECNATYHYEITTIPVPKCNLDGLASDIPSNVFRKAPVWKEFCEREKDSKINSILGDHERTMIVDVHGNPPTLLKRKRDLEGSNPTLVERIPLLRRLVQPRTPPVNLNSDQYSNALFTLSYQPNHQGIRTTNCSEAFDIMAQGDCGRAGGQQNRMAKAGSIFVGDGTYTYVAQGKIETERKEFESKPWTPGKFQKAKPASFKIKDVITENEEHPWRNAIWKICGGGEKSQIYMTPQKHQREVNMGMAWGNTWATAFWKEDCVLKKGPQKQFMNDPLGDGKTDCAAAFKAAISNVKDTKLKKGYTWGGKKDYGCLRYMITPNKQGWEDLDAEDWSSVAPPQK